MLIVEWFRLLLPVIRQEAEFWMACRRLNMEVFSELTFKMSEP